jgi:hypothetical protein
MGGLLAAPGQFTSTAMRCTVQHLQGSRSPADMPCVASPHFPLRSEVSDSTLWQTMASKSDRRRMFAGLQEPRTLTQPIPVKCLLRASMWLIHHQHSRFHFRQNDLFEIKSFLPTRISSSRITGKPEVIHLDVPTRKLLQSQVPSGWAKNHPDRVNELRPVRKKQLALYVDMGLDGEVTSTVTPHINPGQLHSKPGRSSW